MWAQRLLLLLRAVHPSTIVMADFQAALVVGVQVILLVPSTFLVGIGGIRISSRRRGIFETSWKHEENSAAPGFFF